MLAVRNEVAISGKSHLLAQHCRSPLLKVALRIYYSTFSLMSSLRQQQLSRRPKAENSYSRIRCSFRLYTYLVSHEGCRPRHMGDRSYCYAGYCSSCNSGLGGSTRDQVRHLGSGSVHQLQGILETRLEPLLESWPKECKIGPITSRLKSLTKEVGLILRREKLLGADL